MNDSISTVFFTGVPIVIIVLLFVYMIKSANKQKKMDKLKKEKK